MKASPTERNATNEKAGLHFTDCLCLGDNVDFGNRWHLDSGGGYEMSGLLPDEVVKNRNNDTPWKKSERDRMIDLYLSGGNGAHPNTIARTIGRNPKAVKRRLEEYTYNEDGVVSRYVPFRRNTRKGLRWTQNEQAIVKAHRKKSVPLSETARFLMRDVEELSGEIAAEVVKTKQSRTVAHSLDLIWAHRYIYYVYKTPIISDKAYDALVEEEIEYGGGESKWIEIKNHDGWPRYIISLAMYLCEKAKEEQ